MGLPALVSLVALRSVFRSGYLLQVDAVFGPRPAPIGGGFYWPVAALQWAATHVGGGDVTGKIYVAGAFFLVGFGAMVALRGARWYAQCLGGLVAMLNPWVYDRLVEGQWGVVVAAAGLFLWVAAWEALERNPSTATAAALAGVSVATVAFAAPAIVLVVVLVLVASVAGRIWRQRERLRWTTLSQVAFAVALLYGLVPFFTGGSSASYGAISRVGSADFAFFKAVSTAGHGIVVDLVGLFGYWGERTGRFPLATNGWSAWPAASLVIVAAAVAGAVAARRRAWLLATGLVGLGLSSSTAIPGGVSAATWLADGIPLVGGLREPQKASALWLVALSLLAASAADALGRRRGDLAGLALAELLALAALLPAGYAELRSLPAVVDPVHFPASWNAASAAIAREVPRAERIVVLPWHLYEPLPFADGRLTANPAEVFFNGRLVVPDDPEIPGAEPAGRHPELALAELADDRCALARAVRGAAASWALVLDSSGGRADAAALQSCGFRLRAGGPPGPWLLERR